MIVIGTAGHIDHGKSSIVKRLTGTDPDRLPEEKARGMTIDLGFAFLEIPDNKIAPKIRDPSAPATLFAIPIIAILLAPLSIGPNMVMYGFEAVCKMVIPAAMVK